MYESVAMSPEVRKKNLVISSDEKTNKPGRNNSITNFQNASQVPRTLISDYENTFSPQIKVVKGPDRTSNRKLKTEELLSKQFDVKNINKEIQDDNKSINSKRTQKYKSSSIFNRKSLQ